jgi:hypothetical protein
MSQSQDTQKNGSKSQKPELDPETIKAIVAQQSDKLKLEAQKIRLEEKRLDQNGILAEKSLQFNSEIIKRHPSEQRKTIAVIGSIVIAIIVIFLAFILFCLSKGNIEFADKFLNWIGHIGGAVGGFFVGKLSSKKKQPPEDSIQSEPEDAEIVD